MSRVGAVAPWWRALPLDRVVRLHGAGVRDLAESVDPLPDDAPALVFLTPAAGTASTVTDQMVDALEQVAVDLVPLWLPDADLTQTSSLDRRAARVRAHEVASRSAHFGPYLAHLADAATARDSARPDAFSRETRVAGSGRLIADAQHRSSAALLLHVTDDADTDAIAAAAEWVCAHAGIGVWLIGADAMDRFPLRRVNVPDVPDDVRTIVDRFRPLSYPPIAGRPHPRSDAETTLASLLQAREWAAGREHNRGVRLTDLSPTFTVDIVWRTEKVIVEIDGEEHRGAVKFSADRQRDNDLQTHGYLVLRYANHTVLHDHGQVLAGIERALHSRRTKGMST